MILFNPEHKNIARIINLFI